MATAKKAFELEASLDVLRMASLCWKYDQLTARIEKMLVAPSCPPDMREVAQDRKNVKALLESLARYHMKQIRDDAIPELLYFNTWLNLRGGFVKD